MSYICEFVKSDRFLRNTLYVPSILNFRVFTEKKTPCINEWLIKLQQLIINCCRDNILLFRFHCELYFIFCIFRFSDYFEFHFFFFAYLYNIQIEVSNNNLLFVWTQCNFHYSSYVGTVSFLLITRTCLILIVTRLRTGTRSE